MASHHTDTTRRDDGRGYRFLVFAIIFEEERSDATRVTMNEPPKKCEATQGGGGGEAGQTTYDTTTTP
jgi:hypothetical protein